MGTTEDDGGVLLAGGNVCGKSQVMGPKLGQENITSR